MPDDHAPFEKPIGRELSEVARVMERHFSAALADAGGTMPTWHILLALKQRPWRTQIELAEAVGIGNPTLTHHLDALERAGLVTRVRDSDDRRVVRVEMTPAGDEAFLRLRTAAMAFDERIRAGLSKRDLDQLRRLLRRLQENAGD